MLENNTYNILKQLVQEHKSLWRIQNNYKDDAEGHPQCKTYWDTLADRKEKTIQELTDLLKENL